MDLGRARPPADLGARRPLAPATTATSSPGPRTPSGDGGGFLFGELLIAHPCRGLRICRCFPQGGGRPPKGGNPTTRCTPHDGAQRVMTTSSSSTSRPRNSTPHGARRHRCRRPRIHLSHRHPRPRRRRHGDHRRRAGVGRRHPDPRHHGDRRGRRHRLLRRPQQLPRPLPADRGIRRSDRCDARSLRRHLRLLQHR